MKAGGRFACGGFLLYSGAGGCGRKQSGGIDVVEVRKDEAGANASDDGEG